MSAIRIAKSRLLRRRRSAMDDVYGPVTSAIRFRIKPEKQPKQSFPLALLPRAPLVNSVKHTVEPIPPQALTDKLAKILEPHSLRKLTHDFDLLSKETQQFEHSENSGKIPRYDSRRSLAYMAFRMAPAYGCIHAALTRLKDVGYKPSQAETLSVLDFGSGPGTASWVAWEVLRPERMETTFVENSLPMIDAAKQLAEGNFEANWARNLLELSRSYTRKNAARYDLVMATFALGDLASNEARQLIVDMLWSFCKEDGGMLVLMERGTPRGARIVGNARKQIIEGTCEFDANSLFKPAKPSSSSPQQQEQELVEVFPHVLAPCGHERTCPLLENTAIAPLGATQLSANAAPTSLHCHFVQSTARLLKTTTSVRSSHFMSYSYVCIQKRLEPSTKHSIHQRYVRVLTPPKKRMNHVMMDVCGEWDGKVRQTITRKKDGKFRYRSARKAQCGDLYPRKDE